MRTSGAVVTPDELSARFVRQAQSTGAIFVLPKGVSRLRLHDFYQKNAKQLRHFSNDNRLGAEAHRLKAMAGKTVFSRVQQAIANLFESVKVGPDEFPVELTIASHQSRFAIRDDSVGQIVRIEEDNLTPSTLAKYLETYSLLPPDQRPLFIIEAHDSNSGIRRTCEQIPSGFPLASFGEHDVIGKIAFDRRPCASMQELVDEYSENSFCAIARLSHNELGSLLPLDVDIVSQLAARLFHLRASAFERGKFDTLPAAHAALAYLEDMRDQEIARGNASLLLATKVFVNLWILYCSERSRTLFDNSMAMASALGDELIEAHCFRLINTVEPHGSFSDQCLRRAAKIFADRGFYDYANYCLNNALVGRFYEDLSPTTEFTDLVDQSAANIPNFAGLTILMNNAAVAQLIAGKPQAAASLLEKAVREPAMPLHRFGAEVNLIIARYLEGALPSRDEAIRLARAISLQVDGRYQYQIANLLLNLLLAVSADREASSEISQILKGTGALANTDVISEQSSLCVPAARLKLIDIGSYSQRGVRGRFIERYGFVPIFHHTWL